MESIYLAKNRHTCEVYRFSLTCTYAVDTELHKKFMVKAGESLYVQVKQVKLQQAPLAIIKAFAPPIMDTHPTVSALPEEDDKMRHKEWELF